MCGRVTVISPFEFAEEYFEIYDRWEHVQQYNVAPGQQLPVIRINQQNEIELTSVRWGFIPPWMKATDLSTKFSNARLERITTSRLYQKAYRNQRCIILVNGFYEWINQGKQKIPYYFHHQQNKILALGGIWSHWQENGHTIDSCSIITTEANEAIKPYHHRMPLILQSNLYRSWIDKQISPNQNLLRESVSISDLEIYRVDTRVNRASYNQPDCIDALYV